MKILAVEDERHILRMIQVNLQRAGYSVQTATCAQDALRIVEEQQPELVIIDQTLPDIPGDELARLLHARDPAPALLLLFPRGAEAAWMQGWREPANAHLTKPFNPMELIGFVKRILSKNPRGPLFPIDPDEPV